MSERPSLRDEDQEKFEKVFFDSVGNSIVDRLPKDKYSELDEEDLQDTEKSKGRVTSLTVKYSHEKLTQLANDIENNPQEFLKYGIGYKSLTLIRREVRAVLEHKGFSDQAINYIFKTYLNPLTDRIVEVTKNRKNINSKDREQSSREINSLYLEFLNTVKQSFRLSKKIRYTVDDPSQKVTLETTSIETKNEDEIQGQELLDRISQILTTVNQAQLSGALEKLASLPQNRLTKDQNDLVERILIIRKNLQRCKAYLEQNKNNFVKAAEDGEKIEEMLTLIQTQYGRIMENMASEKIVEDNSVSAQEFTPSAATQPEAILITPERIVLLTELIKNRDFEAFCKDDAGNYKKFAALKSELYAIAKSLGDTDESIREFLTKKIIAPFGAAIFEANNSTGDRIQRSQKLLALHREYLTKFRNYIIQLETMKSKATSLTLTGIREVNDSTPRHTSTDLTDTEGDSVIEKEKVLVDAEMRGADVVETLVSRESLDRRAALEQERAEMVREAEELRMQIWRTPSYNGDELTHQRSIAPKQDRLANLERQIAQIDEELQYRPRLLAKAKELLAATEAGLTEGVTLEDEAGVAWIAKEEVRKELLAAIGTLEAKSQTVLLTKAEAQPVEILIQKLGRYDRASQPIPLTLTPEDRADDSTGTPKTTPPPFVLDPESRINPGATEQPTVSASVTTIKYRAEPTIGIFTEPKIETDPAFSLDRVGVSPEGREAKSPFDTYREKLVTLRKELVMHERERRALIDAERRHLNKNSKEWPEFVSANLQRRAQAEEKYYTLLREAEAAGVDTSTLTLEVTKAVREELVGDLKNQVEALETSLDTTTKERVSKVRKWLRRGLLSLPLVLLPTALQEGDQLQNQTIPNDGDQAVSEPARTASPAEALPLERTSAEALPLEEVPGVVVPAAVPSGAVVAPEPIIERSSITGDFTGPDPIDAPRLATSVMQPEAESPLRYPDSQTSLPQSMTLPVTDRPVPLRSEMLTVPPGGTAESNISSTMLRAFQAGGFDSYFSEQGITLSTSEFVKLFEQARVILNAAPERVRLDVGVSSGDLDKIGYTLDGQPSSYTFNAIPILDLMVEIKRAGPTPVIETTVSEFVPISDSVEVTGVNTAPVSIPTRESQAEIVPTVITSDLIAELAENYEGGVDGYNTAFLAWVGALQGSEVGNTTWYSRMFGQTGYDAYSLFANFNDGKGMTAETLTSIMEGPDKEDKLRNLGIPARPAAIRAKFEALYEMVKEALSDPQLAVRSDTYIINIFWALFAKKVITENGDLITNT